MDNRLVGVVWKTKTGWRAASWDRYVGRMPSIKHGNKEDAVMWILFHRNQEVWSAEIDNGTRVLD